jgi:hypothetical protein
LQFIPPEEKISKKFIRTLKEELSYLAVLELDGVVAANIGDKDAKVLATAHRAVGLDYCCAGDGSASDDSYSQHHLALIDYGAGGHGDAKGTVRRCAEHGDYAENGHGRHQQCDCG